MRCRASDCQNEGIVSSLCENHYHEWRTVLDSKKNTDCMKAELEHKYDLPHAPKFMTLGDF